MKLGKVIRRTFLCGALAVSAPKHCSVPIQPMQDRIVSAKSIKDTSVKDILVLDCFKDNNISIDIDNRGDISHGYLTSKIIEDGLPNANVYKKSIPDILIGQYEHIKDSITTPLFKEMRAGKKYDAVNLSIGKEMTFEDMSEMVGEEITPKNIASKKRKIKNFLINNPDYTVATDYLFFKTKAKEITEFINCMDSLSARGTKIYVSAGNGGKESFNLLSLIDNSITVGALDKDGKKAYYSTDHSLVKKWENGIIPLKKTKYGYQLKFDNSTKDIKEHQTTGFWHACIGNKKGTSYSCPRAIVEDFRGK